MEISFGVFAPTLKTQIIAQGLQADTEDYVTWEKIRGALSVLRIQKIIPAGEVAKAESRLFKRIAQTVR